MNDCECGHVDAAHEVTVRVGKAWFTVALAEEEGLLDEAKASANTWWWCGFCEDACRVATVQEIEAAASPGGNDMNELTELRQANSTRVHRWHGPDSEPWTGSDWSNAMCGEAGETANVVKKLRRAETNARNEGDPEVDELLAALGDEIADTIIYLDLLALHYGIELWPAIASKFNRTSAKYGFPERLVAASQEETT